MAFIKFDGFLEDFAAGSIHNFDQHELSVFLTAQQPDVTQDYLKGDIAEIAVGGGYTGAVALSIASRSVVNNQYIIAPTGPYVWTGTGAGFGPLQFAVLYNSSVAQQQLIGYWDYPTPITIIADGEKLTLNVTNGNGLLKLY